MLMIELAIQAGTNVRQKETQKVLQYRRLFGTRNVRLYP